MSVLEEGRVLEAEAEKAVDADVCGPDEGDRLELRLGGEVGDGEQDRQGEISVREIVESGADASVGEIAEHEDVGREEKDGEEQPTRVKLVEEENAQCENERAFEMKENSGFSKHLKG